jgi:hypothetical protein
VVVDSVSSPSARKTRDFQITPNGADAAFISSLPLTGYDTGHHHQVYRYDLNEGLACASCSPTKEQATGEASLPENGLGLTNDGRIFFSSTEGLVDRDLNEKEDVYEWEPMGFSFEFEEDGESRSLPCETNRGCLELISTGGSAYAASLLGVDESGADAYFFTRDKLVEQDHSGNAVKIYDARELGGFPYVPPPFQCKASDECHGPGSATPAIPTIGSLAGTPVGNELGSCGSGLVKKRGKCVKPRHHRHRHKGRHKRHRGGH